MTPFVQQQFASESPRAPALSSAPHFSLGSPERTPPPPELSVWGGGKYRHVRMNTNTHTRGGGTHTHVRERCPWRCQRSTHLDLTLRHPQRIGQASSLWPRQVLRLFEGLLQSEDLLARERGSGVFSLPIFVQQNGSLICKNRYHNLRGTRQPVTVLHGGVGAGRELAKLGAVAYPWSAPEAHPELPFAGFYFCRLLLLSKPGAFGAAVNTLLLTTVPNN